MAHANEAGRAVNVTRIDHALQEMRRVVLRPPTSAVPMPALGRPVDLSKVLACEALAELSVAGQVTISDLAAALQLERSTVSRLIAEAEEEGLVTRGSDPEDRRRVTLELSALGRAVVTFVQGLRIGYLDHATAVFDADDLSRLADLLTRLADSMTASLGPWLDEAVRQSSTSPTIDSAAQSTRQSSSADAIAPAMASLSDSSASTSRTTAAASPGA